MHELCRVRTGNYVSFNWKQALFMERLPKNIAGRFSFSTFLEALHFGLNVMTKSLTKNNGTSLKPNTWFGTNSSFTRKWYGSGCWNKSRNASSQRRLGFKVSTKLGAICKFCVEGIICILHGIGKDNVVRWFFPSILKDVLVAWGLRLASGVGVVLG